MNYGGFGTFDVSQLGPPPKPTSFIEFSSCVPDLSFIVNENNCKMEDLIEKQKFRDLASFNTKKNTDNYNNDIISSPSLPLRENIEKGKNKDSYLKWREKNLELFQNKSKKEQENSNHDNHIFTKSKYVHSTVDQMDENCVLSSNNHFNTTKPYTMTSLLTRIHEISKKLEENNEDEVKEDLDYNQQLIQDKNIDKQQKNFKTVGNNDNEVYSGNDTSSISNISNYRRIRELYNEVFPNEIQNSKDPSLVNRDKLLKCSKEQKHLPHDVSIKHRDDQPERVHCNSPINCRCDTKSTPHDNSKNIRDSNRKVAYNSKYLNYSKISGKNNCICRKSVNNSKMNETDLYKNKQIQKRCHKSHIKENTTDTSQSDSSDDGSITKFKCCDNQKINYTKNKKNKKKNVTVEDLYKIVKLQNEQINILQNQIDRLLEQNNTIKQNEEDIIKQTFGGNKNEKKCICQIHSNNNNNVNTSTKGFCFSVVQENSKIESQNKNVSDCFNTQQIQNQCRNVSIGVMTSFVEVTQKLQQNNNNSSTWEQLNDDVNINKKDITHGISRTRNGVLKNKIDKSSGNNMFTPMNAFTPVAEESFTLNEVDLPVLPIVSEQIPSPQCSVHLDLQDYNSTSSTDDTLSSSEAMTSSSEDDGMVDQVDGNYKCDARGTTDRNRTDDSDDTRVGWTLYDNVVGQVNKILQQNGGCSGNQLSGETRMNDCGVCVMQNATDNGATAVVTRNDVRTATLHQLRQLGVSFVDNDSSAAKRVSFEPVFKPKINAVGSDLNAHCHHAPNKDSITNVNDKKGLPVNYLDEDQILQAAFNIINKRNKMTNNHDGNIPIIDTPQEANNNRNNGLDLPQIHNVNNDLSFATLRYMERYRLLPPGININVHHTNNNKDPGVFDKQSQQPKQPVMKRKKKQRMEHKRRNLKDDAAAVMSDRNHYQQPVPYQFQHQSTLSNKILDITALRQQPKLL